MTRAARTLVFGAFDRHNLGDMLFAHVVAALAPRRERLVFAGFVRDVASALAALDLVVFPSLWEGTPITAFEALAAGKAIVSTDADGLKDILTDGRDALLVPRRDAAALADAIVALARDPDRRAELGTRARETGRRYDMDAFVRKMQRLYVLLHETSRPTRRDSAPRRAPRRVPTQAAPSRPGDHAGPRA